jgi:hypothetical protein
VRSAWPDDGDSSLKSNEEPLSDDNDDSAAAALATQLPSALRLAGSAGGAR